MNEAAPFGRLDQMLSTIVYLRGVWGALPPSQNPGGLGGSALQAKNQHNYVGWTPVP